ncbi:Gamma-aminobutyric acid type B receptor subunit 2 [Trichoplax sp. H2]|nr:Gamma-aminobutyric acid type B receptor subunit 2 [Trichoplax sp. H2]|eukprot:RDD47284.1 Gamma-aminobutyric acid type B receptor subunit 2 [Trichoplax sp. H2]
MLLKHYNWTKVAIIARRSEIYDVSMERLLNDLHHAKIQVITTEGFIPGTNFDRQIGNLKAIRKLSISRFKKHLKITVKSWYINGVKEEDVRIIIGHFQEEDALEIFCQAYKHGMYGADYVWIVPGFLSSTFWDKAVNVKHVNCTPQEIAIAANYSLSIDFATINTADKTTISGMTPQSFDIRYHNWPSIVNHAYWPNSYAGFTYDAVWAEALALNSSLSRITKLNRSLDDFRYSDSEMAGIFKEEMYRVNFSGISNIIEFNKYGDVLPHTTYLVQHQGEVKRAVATIIAKEGLIDFYAASPNVIRWAGKGPPASQIKLVYVERKVPINVFIIMVVLSCMAILLAIAFLIYNNKYRNERVIKMSSPNLNNLIIVGCVSLYLSIIARGAISIIVSPVFCMLAPWLTTLGFATVSGSMFAKTYRAYKILTTKKRISPIHDYHLYGIVAALILAETVILTTWTFIDPMKPIYKLLPREVSSNQQSLVVIPQLLECNCLHNIIWLATILTLNVFVLIFGAFLAYEARNIKLPVMNESKQIALCIYNVALLCTIVIPISFFLPNTFGETYIASSGLILYCTTTTLCIFFVPKVKLNKSDALTITSQLVSVSRNKRSPLRIRNKTTLISMGSSKSDIVQK